jgi:hypothetical protein
VDSIQILIAAGYRAAVTARREPVYPPPDAQPFDSSQEAIH